MRDLPRVTAGPAVELCEQLAADSPRQPTYRVEQRRYVHSTLRYVIHNMMSGP